MTDTAPRRIVITGANRGLGLEFVRQWLLRGERVFALERSRQPSASLEALRREHPDLQLGTCDVSSDDDVANAVREVEQAFGAVDLLVNNAGTYGARSKAMDDVDLDEMKTVFEVNAVGPLRVTRAFMPLVRRGADPAVVHVTSLMGSIADNSSGGSWAYRTSKAALNMINRNIAHDLNDDKIPSVAIHPGWVRTDMGSDAAPLSAEESVSAMIATIDSISREQSGKMVDRAGEPIPW
jgi:NAD(P)-dependent dehydrogenase (short-subunit alcohol dehydrogenase family)